MELCDLYLAVQDYTKAAFCIEELIMSNPHNHLYHQKLAEVCIFPVKQKSSNICLSTIELDSVKIGYFGGCFIHNELDSVKIGYFGGCFIHKAGYCKSKIFSRNTKNGMTIHNNS